MQLLENEMKVRDREIETLRVRDQEIESEGLSVYACGPQLLDCS